ncbi:hypothetical protein CTI12_AA235060 [Artemisia annua]|uniref:Uncharacterized protein n=1 Tax=Artemisia annua TaxID=35608 RepID=A0A2U1NP64_ARTAN|nr:hypothetical protein CTI12_AA235060 [Artemisia annua]
MRTSLSAFGMVEPQQFWDRNESLHRNLRIILKYEGKLDLIETPLPIPPAVDAPAAQAEAYQKLFGEQEKIALLMLASMTLELQKDMEDCTTYDMLKELKGMFQTQPSQEL